VTHRPGTRLSHFIAPDSALTVADSPLKVIYLGINWGLTCVLGFNPGLGSALDKRGLRLFARVGIYQVHSCREHTGDAPYRAASFRSCISTPIPRLPYESPSQDAASLERRPRHISCRLARVSLLGVVPLFSRQPSFKQPQALAFAAPGFLTKPQLPIVLLPVVSRPPLLPLWTCMHLRREHSGDAPYSAVWDSQLEGIFSRTPHSCRWLTVVSQCGER
jgi:hypothetical protein